MITPPRKTELGQQELKQRSRKLSQRHRTLLLLVDGKRSLGEVLGLAQRAGVAVSYFEELVALGMVEAAGLPAAAESVAPELTDSQVAELEEVLPPSAFAALQPPAPEPAPADEVFVGSARAPLDDAAPAEADAPEPVSDEPDLVMTETVVEVVEAEAAEPALDADAAQEANAATVAPVAPSEASAPPVPAEPAAEPRPAGAASAEVPDPPPESVPLMSLAPPSAVTVSPADEPAPPRRPRDTADVLAGLDEDALPMGDTLSPPDLGPAFDDPGESEPAAGDAPEARLLAEVRSLLIGALLVDAPASSALTALRVRRARSADELARLVWEIERSMVRARRPAEAQRRLTRARDLLGLGNTVVHGDSWIGSPRE